MAKFNKLEPIVKEVLEEDAMAREDDFTLLFDVYYKLNEEVMDYTFSQVMLAHKILGLPSFESITRCRRKLQATYEHLQAPKKMKDIRLNETSDYIDYAIDGYDTSFMKMIDSFE